jgi:hypothetical protein
MPALADNKQPADAERIEGLWQATEGGRPTVLQSPPTY